MYGFKSCTIKKAERQRTYTFKLWCWRRLLRVPWTSRRSNQSILKEINPEHSLEELMLRLKLQYFGKLMRRASSLENNLLLEKNLLLKKTEGKRRQGQQRMRWLDSITDLMEKNLSKLQEIVEDRGAWSATVPGVTKSQTGLCTSTTAKAFTNSLLKDLLVSTYCLVPKPLLCVEVCYNSTWLASM